MTHPRWRAGASGYGLVHSATTLAGASGYGLVHSATTLAGASGYGLVHSATTLAGASGYGGLLPVSNVSNRRFETFLGPQSTSTTSVRPPLGANRTRRFSTAGCRPACALLLFQSPRTPRFELVSHVVRGAVRAYDYVNMVASTVHRVQLPTANPTVIGDRRCYKKSLFAIEPACVFGHPGFGLEFANRVGRLKPLATLDPSPLIAGQPSSICCPREKIAERIWHRRLMRSIPDNIKRGHVSSSFTVARRASEGLILPPPPLDTGFKTLAAALIPLACASGYGPQGVRSSFDRSPTRKRGSDPFPTLRAPIPR